MSIKYLNWAFDLDLPADNGKSVLIALSNYADEAGSCFPSQETLALNTGQSISTIHRHIKRLEESGLVTRKARRNGQLRTSDRYYLHIPEPVTMTGGESDPTGHGESLNRSPCIPEPVTMTGEPPVNHQENPSSYSPSSNTHVIEKKRSPKKIRQNKIKDALVAACSERPEGIGEWGKIERAFKIIDSACPHLTDEQVVSEIYRRAKNYKRIRDYAELTANALANNWGKCASATSVVSAGQKYDSWNGRGAHREA